MFQRKKGNIVISTVERRFCLAFVRVWRSVHKWSGLEIAGHARMESAKLAGSAILAKKVGHTFVFTYVSLVPF